MPRTIARIDGSGRAQLRCQLEQQADRQADDVGEVALDPLDERRAEALDRVAAGTLAPLARGEVALDVIARSSCGRSPRTGPRPSRSAPGSGPITARPLSTSWVRPESSSSSGGPAASSPGLPSARPSTAPRCRSRSPALPVPRWPRALRRALSQHGVLRGRRRAPPRPRAPRPRNARRGARAARGAAASAMPRDDPQL